MRFFLFLSRSFFCGFAVCVEIAMAQGRATLNIATEPSGAKVFLDDNAESEAQETPFENSSMISGGHSFYLVPSSESFVPFSDNFEVNSGGSFGIRHRFLRRNQAIFAVSLSPAFLDFETDATGSYSRAWSGGTAVEMPLNFRFGLPLGLGMRLGFPVSKNGVRQTALGLQYTYFPLQIGIAADYVNPRGEGFSALRLTMLTMQNIFFLNLLANATYEFQVEENAEFYLRLGVPVAHIFLPYLAASVKAKQISKMPLIKTELGALLQAGNSVSLAVGTHMNTAGDFGIYLGIQKVFSFEKENSVKSGDEVSGARGAIIWDINEVSNAEFRKWKGERWQNDDYPAVLVSLQEAMDYARSVGKRLPTVEEWKREVSAMAVENYGGECTTPNLTKVYEGKIVNGLRNFSGNVAEWLLPSAETSPVSSVAYFGGVSYGDTEAACSRKRNSVDVSSSKGSAFIGFRLVKDL